MTRSLTPNRYCLPIIKQTSDEVKKLIEEQHNNFGYFEVWLDYIEDLHPDFAASLADLYPGRLIMIFRRSQFEHEKLSILKRMETLESLALKDVLVDLDIFHQAPDIERITSKGIKLRTIFSYHNYRLTPSDEELQRTTELIHNAGALITKVSTLCTSRYDALRLMSLLLRLRDAGRRCIILGMGEHGVITRVFGLSWGNELVFAPIKLEHRSAPGQIPIDKLEMILQTLGLSS